MFHDYEELVEVGEVFGLDNLADSHYVWVVHMSHDGDLSEETFAINQIVENSSHLFDCYTLASGGKNSLTDESVAT